VSEGEIGIATLGEHNVWLSIRGKVLLDRDKNRVIVYLHFNPKHWYYFEWKTGAGVMSVEAQEIVEEGQPTLESILAEMKDSDKEIKQEKGRFKIQWLNGKNSRDGDIEQFREFDE